MPAGAGEPSAKTLYKRGRKYEKKKDFANAYLLYSQAAAADPSRREYWQRAQALQRRAMTAANVMPSGPAGPSPDPEPVEDPLPSASVDEVVEARKPQPPIEIEAAKERKDFNLRADAKSLWEQVLKSYGLEIVFDGDYQAGPVINFRLTEADYREALNALMTVTASFFVPISPRVVLVVKDTEQKRREVENTVSVSIPIPAPVTIQEAQELGRAVQQLMEIQRFAIDSAQRLVILRDRASKVGPARIVFQQLIHRRAQIVVDVQLLSAAKTSTLGLGLGIPTSIPITSLTKTITLAGSSVSLALGIANANLLATATRSQAQTLYEAQIRTVEAQPASLHVGEKYPITTLSYIGQVEPGQTAYTPPPSFNFEDLGLVLKLTPKVHDASEVTLDIETEFKLLGTGSLNGIPVISNRKFATRARLRFGEAAVISGLMTSNDLRSLSGPAGLLNIPVLGPLLGQYNRTRDDVQVLLVMTPHLISEPPLGPGSKEIWVGSESRPRIPL